MQPPAASSTPAPSASAPPAATPATPAIGGPTVPPPTPYTAPAGSRLTRELVTHTSEVTGRAVYINATADRFWIADGVTPGHLADLRADIEALFALHADRVRTMDATHRAKRRLANPPKRTGRWRIREVPNVTESRLLQAGFTASSLAAVRALASATPDGFAAAVEDVVACTFRPDGAAAGTPGEVRRVVEVLVLCWKHGLLAFPHGCVWDGYQIAPGAIPVPTPLLYGSASEFLTMAYNAGAKNARGFVPSLYLVGVGVTEPGDVDTGYIKATAASLFARDIPETWARKGANRKLDALSAVQKAWYRDTPARLRGLPQSYRGTVTAPRREVLRSDPTFEWARRAAGGRVRLWADAAAAFVASLPNRVHVKNDVTSLNVLLDYAAAHADVPADPLDFCQRTTTVAVAYAAYVAETKRGTAKAGSRALAKTRDFFDWLLLERATDEDGLRRGFRNPVAEHDVPPEAPRNGQTMREAIPYRFLRMMREILEAPGPGREPGEPGYDPAPFYWPRQQESDYCLWLNPETGLMERVWSPARAYFYLLRLMLPIRELQVRLLDSGEGDPKVYRPAEGGWVPNTGPFAPRPGERRDPQGFVREMWDAERGVAFNGLFITTNKTQDRADGYQDSGYAIPWGGVDDEIIDLFCRLRDWQAKYNPVLRPMTRAELQDPNLEAAPETAARLTPYYFLFRDAGNKEKPTEPITAGRCAIFWRALVAELERRLEAEGITNDDGSKIVLVTSTGVHGNAQSVRWDPHTLRVSGLTALQQAGVPIHILSEFVAGHATVLMTLYYIKPGTGEINRALDEAAARVREMEAQTFASWLKSAPPDLVEDLVAFNDPVGLAQAREVQSALWAPLDDGICPNGGSMCDQGGEEVVHLRRRTSKEALYGPVEGGARNCALCRFFVTGPAFLAGLVAKFNATAGLIREKLRALTAAEERRRALAHELASHPEAAGDPRLQKRVLRADEAVQQFQADSVVLRKTWMAQLRLITRVDAIMHERRGMPEAGRALVLNGELGDLRVALHECSEYALWDRICQTYEFYPTIDARLPALRRGNLFNAMLAREGRPAVFATLTDDQLLDVGNAAAEFLRARLGDAVTDDLMAGRTTLRELGVLDEFEQIASAAAAGGPVRAELPPQTRAAPGAPPVLLTGARPALPAISADHTGYPAPRRSTGLTTDLTARPEA